MKKLASLCCFLGLLAGCDGKPSGISDEFYEKYKILGAPKILYQCGDKVGYSAGVGINATYNRIVEDARKKCDEKFKIMESQQYATDKR